MNRTTVIGLDPGTGSKSPCGLSIFCLETKQLIYFNALWTKFKLPHQRIKDISDEVGYLIDRYKDCTEYSTNLVCIETFVMRGESGQTLQQLIGALLTKIPFTFTYKAVYNTTVKRIVGGKGTADKAEVAEGVARYFSANKESANKIKQLIKDEQWDILDSLAIGIAGQHQLQE